MSTFEKQIPIKVYYIFITTYGFYFILKVQLCKRFGVCKGRKVVEIIRHL